MNATESAERGEVVGEVAGGDVELVARALSRCSLNEFGERLQERRIPFAEAILAALTAAGRLLPPVVQTREERGTRIGDGSIITLAEAGSRYTLSAQSLRVRTISTLADDGSPYGGATLTSAWREVGKS